MIPPVPSSLDRHAGSSLLTRGVTLPLWLRTGLVQRRPRLPLQGQRPARQQQDVDAQALRPLGPRRRILRPNVSRDEPDGPGCWKPVWRLELCLACLLCVPDLSAYRLLATCPPDRVLISLASWRYHPYATLQVTAHRKPRTVPSHSSSVASQSTCEGVPF